MRETFLKELADAGTVAKKTQQALGVSAPDPTGRVRERGIIVGGKAVAKAELDESLRVQDQFITQYLRQAGFSTNYEAGIAKQHLEDRLNAIRFDLVKQANAWNKKLEKEKMSREKKKMLAGNIGAMVGAIAGGIAGGYLSGGNPKGAMLGASVGGAAGSNIGQMTQRG